MSCFVLDQDQIEVLVPAVNAVLELNKEYCLSFYLAPDTITLLSRYTGDLHKIYRMLYIFNLKAVNGRYHEDAREFPKYRGCRPWDLKNWPERFSRDRMECVISTFRCYMYQVTEDATVETPLYAALRDIQKTLCYMYSRMVID